jgi:hypothetical protein
MMSVGAEDGSRRLAYHGSRGIAPRPLWGLRPLIEIGEEKSLRRELSAGFSEGKVQQARDMEVS